MHMIAAIAFVLVADVVTSFEHLIDNTDFPEKAQSVLDYFEDTWIGRPNRLLIRRPLALIMFCGIVSMLPNFVLLRQTMPVKVGIVHSAN